MTWVEWVILAISVVGCIANGVRSLELQAQARARHLEATVAVAESQFLGTYRDSADVERMRARLVEVEAKLAAGRRAPRTRTLSRRLTVWWFNTKWRKAKREWRRDLMRRLASRALFDRSWSEHFGDVERAVRAVSWTKP